MDVQSSKELLPENSLPVNQLSKQALKKVEEKPDPRNLYWVQLLDWFLELPDLKLARPEFLDLWQSLKGNPPKVQQWWLDHNTAGPESSRETSLVLDPKREYSPEELASELLDSLESNLQAGLPSYGEQSLEN